MNGHTAEAEVCLNRIPGLQGEPSEFISLAQVHATLALVEQQRIANLIAWGIGSTTFAEGTPERRAADDIREGLGL